MSNTIATEMRACADIGMHALDRSIEISCVHRTKYCAIRCYNQKLFKVYPAMHTKDARNETAWHAIDAQSVADLRASLARRKRNNPQRFRLMTRGEAFSNLEDVERVLTIAAGLPDQLIWIPTRAWREPLLRAVIESRVAPLANVVVLASLDPDNTEAEWRDLASAGWSTMYFGKPGEGWEGPPDTFACPKTTHTARHPKGIKGHCGVCKAGCFAPRTIGRRVDVGLTEH